MTAKEMSWFSSQQNPLIKFARWIFRTSESPALVTVLDSHSISATKVLLTDPYFKFSKSVMQLKRTMLDCEKVYTSSGEDGTKESPKLTRSLSFSAQAPLKKIRISRSLDLEKWKSDLQTSGSASSESDDEDSVEEMEWREDRRSTDLCDASVSFNLFDDDETQETVAKQVDRVLGGSLGHVYTRNILELPLTEVELEKMQVKNKLREYDTLFASRTGRKPSKKDKEHLLPLYRRYYELRYRLETFNENNLQVNTNNQSENDLAHLKFSCLSSEASGWIHSAEHMTYVDIS
mmetsp:Transcript_20073/g.27794  ORF Transcript_20073/g.27794 Transcript_20073/m.27794 type:complete len:291 (-) Transcript_20073:245-1117(-)|eukprot:CAMPEP_0196580218 /NCGR_PEP_ID=MMETSP1081-20130531/27852_1 /TAXON_ID=36882 /ORGANISM="Pyramimonas amylifera, Strain CCMP720" /LENGTH=290 /DNA_ID=CAMNT_0041900037 /DNA_START=231 /DNA_END=1103 /DNA_ORIENTATION=-